MVEEADSRVGLLFLRSQGTKQYKILHIYNYLYPVKLSQLASPVGTT